MKAVDTAHTLIARLLRIAAALSVGGALVTWVTPVNAPGKNLIPVGCGSPASPELDSLTDFVCRDLVSGSKASAVALALAAGVLLLLSELVVPQLRGHRWVQGAAAIGAIAVPVIALAGASLFSTVASTAADGTLIRCGTPLSQATDRISVRLCGDLAERQRSLGLGVICLSALSMVGGGYVGSAMARRDDQPDGAGVDQSAAAQRDSGPYDSADPGREAEPSVTRSNQGGRS